MMKWQTVMSLTDNCHHMTVRREAKYDSSKSEIKYKYKYKGVLAIFT